jgi:hypothetical protein
MKRLFFGLFILFFFCTPFSSWAESKDLTHPKQTEESEIADAVKDAVKLMEEKDRGKIKQAIDRLNTLIRSHPKSQYTGVKSMLGSILEEATNRIIPSNDATCREINTDQT